MLYIGQSNPLYSDTEQCCFMSKCSFTCLQSNMEAVIYRIVKETEIPVVKTSGLRKAK